MELNDWIINQQDLHYITKKQYRDLYRSGLKAMGDYLLRGRKMVSLDDDEKMVIGKSVHYTVYLCEWRGLLVAVKKLDLEDSNKFMTQKLTKHLKDEIVILVKMHHPNIVQILGITLEPFQIVLEYFPLRDLNYFRKTSSNSFFSWSLFSVSFYRTKYKWTIDLLLALIYLHERRPESVIHRDLKPSNVLVTNDGSLKITDFGLSKLHRDYENMYSSDQNLENLMDTHPKKFDTFDIGTYWYMCPEIRSHTPYDNKMDIWSLGLILFEIWENRAISTIVSSPMELLEHNATRDRWIPFTFRTPVIMRQVILQCLDVDPNKRPSVRHILAKTFALPRRFLWC